MNECCVETIYVSHNTNMHNAHGEICGGFTFGKVFESSQKSSPGTDILAALCWHLSAIYYYTSRVGGAGVAV